MQCGKTLETQWVEPVLLTCQTNKKQELSMTAMFDNDRNEMRNFNTGPSIDASYQILVHLARQFQRRRLKCEKLTGNGHQVMAKTKTSNHGAAITWVTLFS